MHRCKGSPCTDARGGNPVFIVNSWIFRRRGSWRSSVVGAQVNGANAVLTLMGSLVPVPRLLGILWFDSRISRRFWRSNVGCGFAFSLLAGRFSGCGYSVLANFDGKKRCCSGLWFRFKIFSWSWILLWQGVFHGGGVRCCCYFSPLLCIFRPQLNPGFNSGRPIFLGSPYRGLLGCRRNAVWP